MFGKSHCFKSSHFLAIRQICPQNIVNYIKGACKESTTINYGSWILIRSHYCEPFLVSCISIEMELSVISPSFSNEYVLNVFKNLDIPSEYIAFLRRLETFSCCIRNDCKQMSSVCNVRAQRKSFCRNSLEWHSFHLLSLYIRIIASCFQKLNSLQKLAVTIKNIDYQVARDAVLPNHIEVPSITDHYVLF